MRSVVLVVCVKSQLIRNIWCCRRFVWSKSIEHLWFFEAHARLDWRRQPHSAAALGPRRHNFAGRFYHRHTMVDVHFCAPALRRLATCVHVVHCMYSMTYPTTFGGLIDALSTCDQSRYIRWYGGAVYLDATASNPDGFDTVVNVLRAVWDELSDWRYG